MLLASQLSVEQAARQTPLPQSRRLPGKQRQMEKKVGPAFGKPEQTQGVQRRLDDEDRRRVNHHGAAIKC